MSTQLQRTERKADGEWLVSRMDGQQAVKTYLCPGCQKQVRPGETHVVVWPAQPGIGSTSAVIDRRHWHTACWRLKR